LGTIDEDYAKLLRAVNALRSGNTEGKLIDWLAARYNVDLSEDGALENLNEKTQDVPGLESELVLWRPVYKTSESERVFRHVIDGKPALFKIDNALWDSFAGMAPLGLHPGLQTFAQMNRLFKMGATGIKYTFAPVNLARDFQVFLAQEKNLKGVRRITEPFKWTALFAMSELNNLVKERTGRSIFEDNEVAQLFEEMSGKIVNSLGVSPSQVSSMRKSVARKSGWAGPHEMARAGGYRIVQTIRDLVGLMESGPRLAAFNAYLESRGYKLIDGKITKDGKPKRPTQSELVRAINEARDVTTNFVRSGSTGRFVDQFVPFFNAAVQSQDKEARALLEGGKDVKAFFSGGELTGAGKRVMGYMLASSAATVAYWLMRHDDDDYEEMPEWLKYGFWSFQHEGTPIAKVPRAHTWSMAGVATEAMLNALADGDKEALKEAASQQIGLRNPVSGPAVVTPVAEAFMNFDTFRWKNIENQSMQGLPPHLRYHGDTSEGAKAIGYITGQYGFSPVDVDHILDQSTGGLGKSVGKSPLAGFGIPRDYSKSVDKFYDLLDTTEQNARAAKVIDKQPDPALDAQASELNAYREMMTDMRASIRNEEDRDKRFETEKYIIGLARFALGEPELDRYPNPLKDKSSPEHIKQLRQEIIIRKAETLTSYQPKELTKLEKEAGLTKEQKVKDWETKVEHTRQWFKKLGIDSQEAAILLKIGMSDVKDMSAKAKRMGRVHRLLRDDGQVRGWFSD
jgi:hypothetical protein